MDVNSTRIILEQSLDKYRLPLYLAKEEKSEFGDLLCSFEKILSTPKCYNAINLSWKLFLINCKTWIEKDDLNAIFTRYNNVYCVYREILIRVWDKRNNSKVNSVLDEIGSFGALELLMRGFEFNLIHNIYVPTEEELEKLIDVNKYHEKMTLMMSEDSKFGGRVHADGPSDIGGIQKIANPLELNINEITENIAKLPAVKNMDTPSMFGMPAQSKGDSPNEDSPRKGSVNLVAGKSADEIALAASGVKLGLSKDPEEAVGGTPMTPSKSAAKEPVQPSNKQLDKLLEIEAWDVSEWTEAHTSEFIQIYKRKEEDSPVILIKAYTLMKDIPPEKVFRLIYDLDIRTEWDNVLSNMKIFGKVNDNVDHMYSLYKAPIGISNRDFCQRRTKSVGYKGTAFIIHFESVDHPECPPLKGVIRAHTTISGYVIRPSAKFPGSTQMTIMTQTDIKGMVPKMIVNMAAAKAPSDWCKNFKKNADRLIKAGKL